MPLSGRSPRTAPIQPAYAILRPESVIFIIIQIRLVPAENSVDSPITPTPKTLYAWDKQDARGGEPS